MSLKSRIFYTFQNIPQREADVQEALGILYVENAGKFSGQVGRDVTGMIKRGIGSL